MGRKVGWMGKGLDGVCGAGRRMVVDGRVGQVNVHRADANDHRLHG
jgi:hypothetical protein